jgi:2'-5' RNA ligase
LRGFFVRTFAQKTTMEMYYLALLLPPHLNERVQAYKHWMHEKWGSKAALKSPAHITIIPPFWMKADLEPLLQQTAEQIAATTSAFSIHTTHFSSFPPRTIFIAVEDNPELQAFQHHTEHCFLQVPALGIKKDSRPFHPHITIATRDLAKKNYYEAWSLLSGKECRMEWMAAGLSILKHNKKNWDVWHTSQFG